MGGRWGLWGEELWGDGCGVMGVDGVCGVRSCGVGVGAVGHRCATQRTQPVGWGRRPKAALWGCVGLWGCRAARGPRTAQPAPQLPHSSPLSFMDITALEMSCMAAYGGPVFPYIALGGYPGQGGCGVMGRYGVTGGAVGGGDAVGFRWGDVGL